MEAASDEENQNRNNTSNNINSNEAQSKPKRQMKTPFQLQTLERAYALEPYPTEASRAELSEKLGLSDRQLQMWFCHRRLKDKKEGQAKEAASKKPRNAMAEEAEDEARSEHGSHSGSGSRSGSSPLGYGQLGQVLSGNMGPKGRRSYESPQSIFELRVIASVEAQLGEPLRDDGPILGMEFDPLPPDAFGAPIAIVEHQKQSAYRYEEKAYEHRDAKSKKGAARAFLDYPFHQDKSSTRSDAYGRVGPSHFYDLPIDGPSSETSAFLHRTEPSSREYGEQGYVSHARVLSQQDKQERILSSPGDYDSVPRSDSFMNSGKDAQFSGHPIGPENSYVLSDRQITHNCDVLRMDRKRKGEEARTEAEAHEKRIRKELEKQDILRRKREEQMRKEMERHDRERRKEEERLMRERQREVERLQREQRRELERREKFLQKESLRAEKKRQKEELRREKEAVRLKASIEKATARRIAKESMELIEDDRLEMMELAATSKGLPSIVSLDHDTLQNLESFRDLLSSFPPKSVQLRRPFAVQPWVDSEDNIGNLLMVWRFLITFADVLQLWPFTLDEFVQAFHDYDSRLLGEIHIALIKLIIKDIEDVARTPSLGLGTNQNAAAGPEGGHPHIVEGAYAWGFDIRNWQRHLNPLTWPEILRQFALSAGFGPQLKKRSSEWSYSRENNEMKGCEDIVSTLRNGSAAVNAVAIMKGKGFSLSRRSRHRLTPGTVKFAVFHVLSLEGSKGLTILELADKIQKSGLRDLTRSKAPEASISAALSRDAALFERTAPCTYCVRPTFRKDPADAEKVLSAAREKVHIFENGFLAGEDVDDVERDEDSECDVAEGPEVDDLGTPNTNKNTIHLNDGSACSGNGKENVSNDVINPQNEVDKDFSSLLSSGTKVTNTASVTLNRYGAGNPDQENIEIDESNSGEPWVQGLAEGEYSDLSVEERLNALVALIGVANEGNTIRAILEDRLEAAIALKKQMWAEAQLDKKRLKEENITKVQYTSCMVSKADMKPTSAAAEGSQSPLPVDNKNNEASVSTAVGQQPSVSSHNVQNHLGTLPTEGTSIVQEFSTVPNNFISQHAYDAERSRLQLKSYIAHRAEDIYVYRSLPLGQDRRRNRYWQFVASASRNDPGSGRIFVELHDGHWRLIDSEEAFDALITSLDTRGIRESHLHAMLQKIEMAFKENVRRNSQCVDNVGQTRTTVKNETTEMDSNPDCIACFDSPNSTVCGLVSDALEPFSSFGIELGRNEMEKKAALKRYQDFQKWMWKECFNSEALCSMKYGKKRCTQLLSICDFCFECYFNEDNHCPSCHRTFGSFDNNVHFLEHVIQCENKKKTNPEDLHISDSSLPLGIRLLKALLAFIEVSIPLDALESFWMEGYQRETWGMKIQTSSSLEDLLQIVTLLEAVIKQDRLSSEFRTTKELLGSCTPSWNAVYDSSYTGSVPVLAWIPQTAAAVAVRLLELDASISYIHHEKSECHEDKKELGEFRQKFPSRYAPVKNAQEVEISGFHQDIHKKEENWSDLGNGRDSTRHGHRGRGRGRGRIHGERFQRRVSSSRPHTGKHNARDNPNLNRGQRLQNRRTHKQESQGQGCRRGPRTVRRRADKRAVEGTPLCHLGDMVRPKGKGESHRNLIGEGWGKFTMMQMDNVDNHSSGDAVESDDNAPETEREHGGWGVGFDGASGGQTGDLMEVSDEDAEASEDDNGSEEEGEDDSSEDVNMNECSDGLVNGVGNEDLGTEYATSEDYSD